MRLLADENVEQPLITRLRADGHEIWSVAEVGPGMTDDAVLSWADHKQCVLLTGDKDFGELIYRLGRASHGVVLIRLPGLSVEDKLNIVSETLRLKGSDMQKSFTVISERLVRIRRPQ